MKPIIQKTAGLLLALFIVTAAANAQAPNMFNYQAVARNASGAVLSSQAIGIQFSILNGSNTGTVVYKETQTATTNSLGLFTVSIGSGTPLIGTISGVTWSLGSKFLQVEIDPTGGTSYTVTGTSELLSVPYALYAGGGITGTGTAGALPVFTSASSVASSNLIQNSSRQLSTNNGAVIGAASLSVTDPNGSLYTNYQTNDPNGASLAASNSYGGYSFYALTNNIAGGAAAFVNTAAQGIFANFSNSSTTTSTPLVKINSTNNGHGQVVLASDSASTAYTGFINMSRINGFVVGCAGSAGLTSTCGGTNFSSPCFTPYADNGCNLGLSNYRWTAVYAVNGTIQTSDSRQKENIQPITYGLNTLMQLKPVSYNWKDKKAQIGTGTNLGFIAQEVEKVLPDVIVHTVHTEAEIAAAKKDKGVDMKKDNYGVKYAEFTPVLVKAIQEQQQQILDLQKLVQELTKKINNK